MKRSMRISIEDKDAIRELLARYSHAMGRGDPDGVAACFLEDAVFEGRAVRRIGHAQIRLLGTETTAARVQRYIVSNIIITERADERDAADVLSTLLSYAYTKDGPRFLTSGTYQDIVVKVNGDWKFRHRIVRADQPVEP